MPTLLPHSLSTMPKPGGHPLTCRIILAAFTFEDKRDNAGALSIRPKYLVQPVEMQMKFFREKQTTFVGTVLYFSRRSNRLERELPFHLYKTSISGAGAVIRLVDSKNV